MLDFNFFSSKENCSQDCMNSFNIQIENSDGFNFFMKLMNAGNLYIGLTFKGNTKQLVVSKFWS